MIIEKGNNTEQRVHEGQDSHLNTSPSESEETAEERQRKAERLSGANRRWRDAYGDPVTDGGDPVTNSGDPATIGGDGRGEGCEGKVKFSAPETWAVHVEDPALAADLKEAREEAFSGRVPDFIKETF